MTHRASEKWGKQLKLWLRFPGWVVFFLLAGATGCDRQQAPAARPTAQVVAQQPEKESPSSVPVPAAAPVGASSEMTPPTPSAGRWALLKEKAQAAGHEVAVLAGGCFWGMEEILRSIPGVLETEVGYAGGHTSGPRYDQVKTGSTGHAESVAIVFDPQQLDYAELLEKWFFKMHDPTTKNRQGNDVGSQYRSAIFTTSAEQGVVARQVIERVNKSGAWPAPLVTEVSAAGQFSPAHDSHQDYLQKHPGGYTCHYLRDDTY